ncbi:MAG: chromate resistance protein [Proteobacteria bacterium]|nr:chromate resistance protein [Pseudomonadota bacterium]
MDTATSRIPPFVSVLQLADQLGQSSAPLILDARKGPAFDAAADMIPGALRLLPEDVPGKVSHLMFGRNVVAYCGHGQESSQNAARSLLATGIDARYLEGGIEAWKEAGLPTLSKAPECGVPATIGRPSRWISRERPKVDRIACPWLIRRFIDPTAEFLYVPAGQVIAIGTKAEAIPYDVPDVRFSHRGAQGELCSFDAFIADFALNDPALRDLARIVRGADTGKPNLSPQSPGLVAISLGLSVNYPDDHAMLEQGMVIYDALYSWVKSARAETHNANLFKKS